MQNHKDIKTDILVAGGGLAGVACALSAARCGSKVVLCQDRPVLGGNASSEIRMHAVGADCSGGRGQPLATEAREGGIIEEIRLENTVHNPQRSPSVFDLILYDKCRSEPNITLLLNTTVTGCTTSGRRIMRVSAENRSAERDFTIKAEIYIDCTGDGSLALASGARFSAGRESSADYSESLAPDKADSNRLGSTLMFQARKHKAPMPFKAPAWARRFTEEDLVLRPHADTTAAVDTGLEYGYWWVEWGGNLDTISDGDEIRDELLAVMMGVWDHIKNGGPEGSDHGADNWALEWIGFLPGKRESRRFAGLYTLTQDDLLMSRRFDDAIAYGGWPIDLHPPGGVDSQDEAPCIQYPVPALYDIPLRSCISSDIKNLMFAGRNISATHIAFASVRVMATAAAVGQGVGTAAALAVSRGLQPAELSPDGGKDSSRMIWEIRQRLLRDDAFLIGRINGDGSDLARTAAISASSEQPGGEAVNIVSDQTRSVHGPGGVIAGRTTPGTHRWMSAPGSSLPQWIELCWDKPVEIGRVELVFDTGMHRILTLTQSDAYAAKMEWGRAQSETACDYLIEAEANPGGAYEKLESIKNNYQRKRVHILSEAVNSSVLRVTITKTNGIDHARIFEIRVYAP
jgi:hypothetical protein